MDEMISDDSVRFLVTMPLDVRKWLEERAKYNGGSVSAEIVRTARERVDETETPRPSGVAS
jgi:Arc-like DNA binding domain